MLVANDVANVCSSMLQVQGNERSIRPVLWHLWHRINCTFTYRYPVCATYFASVFDYMHHVIVTVANIDRHSDCDIILINTCLVD